MSSSAEASESPTFCLPEARIFVLIAAILASSMGFIDSAVLAIAVPAIRTSLGASLTDAQWINNAYLLFLSALMLLGGAAGDRFGLKRVFSAGIGLFMLASLACALAPDAAALIAARAVQGAGAAMMIPGSLAIIAAAYPPERRGRAIGIWASTASLTTILGPILGGFVLTALGDWSWRLIFAINLPLGAAALALLWLKVDGETNTAGRKLDVVGGILVTLALFAIALALTGSGNDSVPPLSHMVLYGGAGVVLLGVFLLWESRTRTPMMPLTLFANVRFAGANALSFALYFALGGTLFYLPMTMISAWGATPGIVAIALSPLGIALTFLSAWSGRLADRHGPGLLITAGAVLAAIAYCGMAVLAGVHDIWLVTVPLMALLGIGMGLVVSPLSAAVMTALPDRNSGIASGVNNAVSRVAGLFAVAILGSIAAVVFERALGPLAEHAVFFGLVPDTPLSPAGEAARIAASDAAFAAVAWTTAAVSLVAAAIAWLTLERRGKA